MKRKLSIFLSGHWTAVVTVFGVGVVLLVLGCVKAQAAWGTASCGPVGPCHVQPAVRLAVPPCPCDCDDCNCPRVPVPAPVRVVPLVAVQAGPVGVGCSAGHSERRGFHIFQRRHRR